jgi:uncharacterized RDD family membrane protein YckC
VRCRARQADDGETRLAPPTAGRAGDRFGEHAAYSVVVPAPIDPAPTDPGMPPASTDGGAGPDRAPATPTFLRRFGALLVDWMIAQLVVVLLLRIDTTAGGTAALAPLGVFALYTVLLVSLTGGATLGHRLFGMQVWQVRPGAFPLQVVIRTLLLCLVVPAVLTSRDGRGFHDVAAGTRIVRP